ncbi:hypothetical protein [Desulfoscipio sp. XC116]|uniref:hypothetical protein n=1 Tax=Desulfoscipio sp. XC116 TaxID=3144975 RepID=UPI00325B206D
MPDEHYGKSLYTEKLQEEQEVPILSPRWLNVLESEYINTFDDALDVLEDAQQINAMDVLEDQSARYIK